MTNLVDWTDCNFTTTRDGEEVHVIRYRRVGVNGPNSTIYEFTVVTSDGLAMLTRYEMRRVDK